MEITYDYIPTNGIRLHTAIAGPKNGTPVILLHGFPDAWFGWQSQIHALVSEGFHVIVPDQRGYNLSDKPKGKTKYHLNILSQDILGLADSLGLDQFHLAGHDFGAMVSWIIAMSSPERLKKLVIANVPHPIVMQQFIRKNFAQMRKSWYAFFFKIPKLPEWYARRKNWKMLMSAMAKGLSEKERNQYRDAWAQENAMTSMINWYRVMSLRSSARSDRTPKIHIPTLILWGKRDHYLSYEMAQLSVEVCEDGKLVTFEDASHWVHQDEPDRFNQLMIEHFKNE
ncbi:MAG: alpha/beta fold hydrolase [Candidatus Hodarchaeales archaeon]|jgi:pimeloyl-ACP methyl ester carboxylesterase